MKKKDLSLKEILNENNFPYIKDYKVFRTLGLKLLDRCVLSEILSYNIKGMEYTGSFEYICKEFNVSKNTALNTLRKLEKAKYITKTASKGRKTSIYSINEGILKQIFLNSAENTQLNNPNYGKFPQLKNTNSSKSEQLSNINSAKSEQLTVQKLDYNCSKNEHNNKYNNNKNNNKNIYAQSKIDASIYTQEKEDTNLSKKQDKKVSFDKEREQKFNEFWKIYPKKRDKAQARKIWLKLKPNDELFNKIIMAVKEQAQTEQWQKDNGQYIPYPSTWLNGKRWEDEIKKVASNNPPQNKNFIMDNLKSDKTIVEPAQDNFWD